MAKGDSAANLAGIGANSDEASARPTSATPPQLGASLAAGRLELTWPSGHTGWQLWAQTNSLAAGIGTNWALVAGSAGTNQVSLPVDPANGSVFFRLVHP